MGKLYIFAIGGTGARVLKSLVMLLASGVKINASDIVPIIIDPDQANGDVSRTIAILRDYQNIRNRLNFGTNNQNQFFATSIKDVTNDFRLKLHNVENKKFRHFIGFDSLDQNNKALASLLFSNRNLEADMDVGFKGNPNIGSVVLNQFKDSQDYANFAADFAHGDRIFIISSIFGGTGASGFPLLVKNIREPKVNLAATALLKDAIIGAVTVLPYFGVKNDPNSAIDKSTFIAKTKAALNYYKDNVSGNSSLNALYYIGDNPNKDQDNHEGSVEQLNEAHFIELASALAIVDFMTLASTTQNGKAQNPIYKEYGLQKETSAITFKDLGSWSNQIMKNNLTQYALFCLFLKNKLNDSLGQGWANASSGVKIDSSFVMSPFYATYLTDFNTHFHQWLTEMRSNSIAFAPLLMDIDKKNLFEFVSGQKPKSTSLFSSIKGSNYHYIDSMLNKVERDCANGSGEQKFMDMFYLATEKVVAAKY